MIAEELPKDSVILHGFFYFHDGECLIPQHAKIPRNKNSMKQIKLVRNKYEKVGNTLIMGFYMNQ